jgi:hypothetical protein
MQFFQPYIKLRVLVSIASNTKYSEQAKCIIQKNQTFVYQTVSEART